jgi:hypothetical protein
MVHVPYSRCHGWLNPFSQPSQLSHLVTIVKAFAAARLEFQACQLNTCIMLMFSLGVLLSVVVSVFMLQRSFLLLGLLTDGRFPYRRCHTCSVTDEPKHSHNSLYYPRIIYNTTLKIISSITHRHVSAFLLLFYLVCHLGICSQNKQGTKST